MVIYVVKRICCLHNKFTLLKAFKQHFFINYMRSSTTANENQVIHFLLTSYELFFFINLYLTQVLSQNGLWSWCTRPCNTMLYLWPLFFVARKKIDTMIYFKKIPCHRRMIFKFGQLTFHRCNTAKLIPCQRTITLWKTVCPKGITFTFRLDSYSFFLGFIPGFFLHLLTCACSLHFKNSIDLKVTCILKVFCTAFFGCVVFTFFFTSV